MRKPFSLALALCLATSALVGCGGDSKGNDPQVEEDAGIEVIADAGSDVDAGNTPSFDDMSPKELVDQFFNIILVQLDAEKCMFLWTAPSFTEEYHAYITNHSLDLRNTVFMLDIFTNALHTEIDSGALKLSNPDGIKCILKKIPENLWAKLNKNDPNYCENLWSLERDDSYLLFDIDSVIEECIGSDLDLNTLIQGTIPTGEKCTSSIECISGNCFKGADFCNGICVDPAPLAKENEYCDYDDECESNLVCSNDDKCVPKTAGNYCNDKSECPEDMDCLKKTGSRRKMCTKPGEEGSACNGHYDCAGTLVCSKSTCKPQVGEGGDCTEDDYLCEDDLVCQKTSDEPFARTCMTVKGQGEKCAIEADTHNETCIGGHRCSPDGVCIPMDTVTEGNVCHITHANNTTTDYGCIQGYTCSKETKKCVKLAEIGQACEEHTDCYDVMIYHDGVTADDDERLRPYRPKSMATRDAAPALKSSVRCVSSPLAATPMVCRELQPVDGACMAEFESPKSGCKMDLICMPNESGADVNGYTGQCKKAPGLNEKCATHAAYTKNGKLMNMCDVTVSRPVVNGEECICSPKATLGQECSGEYDCADDLICGDGKCMSLDMMFPPGVECLILDGKLGF